MVEMQASASKEEARELRLRITKARLQLREVLQMMKCTCASINDDRGNSGNRFA